MSEEKKIAIIGGTGDLGFGLALRWGLAGARVCIGSREEGKAREAAQRARKALQAHAPAKSGEISVSGLANPDAVAGASFAVLAVPISAQAAILKTVRDALRGTILVDATVPLAAALGGKPTQMLGLWQGSAAAQARSLVPADVPVVSAFHNVSAEALQDLSVTPECDIFVCGDDAAAKETFFPLVKMIPGLRPIDAGGLEMSRIVESVTALLISINRRYRVHASGIRVTGLPIAP